MKSFCPLLIKLFSLKKESNKSSSNKWLKTLYLDYLHCIANVCVTVLYILSKQINDNTKFRKQILKFLRNTWKYFVDEFLPVLAQFLWTMK